MKKNLGIYIIAKCNDTVKFLGCVSGWGWTWDDLNRARVFKSTEEAKKILQNSEFTKRQKCTDGTLLAPYLLRSAAGLSNEKKNETISIQIVDINLEFDVIRGTNVLVYDIAPTVINEQESNYTL